MPKISQKFSPAAGVSPLVMLEYPKFSACGEPKICGEQFFHVCAPPQLPPIVGGSNTEILENGWNLLPPNSPPDSPPGWGGVWGRITLQWGFLAGGGFPPRMGYSPPSRGGIVYYTPAPPSIGGDLQTLH